MPGCEIYPQRDAWL
jgi:hypothetical protein